MRSGRLAADIDAYIAAAPAAVRARLTQLRTTIAACAPHAEEAIVYGMPTFRLHGNLVHFAAFAKHIGFYPGPEAIVAHATELTPYVTSKGAIQFPLDALLPLSLVQTITTYRVAQSVAKAAAKPSRRAR
jgi:uncharacterized protein YdhG (YjbR/CyaY superfamily)